MASEGAFVGNSHKIMVFLKGMVSIFMNGRARVDMSLIRGDMVIDAQVSAVILAYFEWSYSFRNLSEKIYLRYLKTYVNFVQI